MATIHRAIDDRFDRIVCVKLLRLELDGPSSSSGHASANAVYRHFLREAQALSRLQHPNTLRIYDFGYLDDGQRPFQVSEFLDGGNLRQHIRAHGVLAPEGALAILEPITGAIAEAHEQKILHRDIKPSNILFSRVGGVLIPKLADFGIARSLRARHPRADETDEHQLAQGLGLFSPRWAAPEQLLGETEGPETDVYALGLVAAFMLTGINPFDGTELPEVFDPATRSDGVVARRLRQMGIPAELLPVFMRAIAADPRTRTAAPGIFFEELRAAFGAVRAVFPSSPKGARRIDHEGPSSPGGPARTRDPAPRAPPPPPVSRSVRQVTVDEKLELDIVGERGVDVRFRVTLVPARDPAFHVQLKGLNCFVGKADGGAPVRPSTALTATGDGAAEFVSTKREPLARVLLAFGRPTPDGRGHVFPVAGGDLVITSTAGSFAVALDLGPEREIVVLSKRP
jgi:serine/threonine-protein kinase